MKDQKEPTPISSGIGELDALVLREFNAVERRTGAARKGSERSAREARGAKDTGPDENIIFSQKWRQAPRTSADEGKAPVVDPDGLLEDDATGPELQFENLDLEDERATESLLTEEEEAFVDQAVSWLGGRPNPDIIMDRIWRSLLDNADNSEVDETEEPSEPALRSLPEDDAGPPDEG